MRIEWNSARSTHIAHERARRALKRVFKDMEYQKKRKEALLNPPKPVSGIKTMFLEEKENNGYYSAKNFVNNKFGREIYTDEILLTWIGIEQPRKVIFEASKEGIENAYKKADEINEKVGEIVIKRETVDLWVKEEQEKQEEANKEQSKDRDKDENDDAR